MKLVPCGICETSELYVRDDWNPDEDPKPVCADCLELLERAARPEDDDP